MARKAYVGITEEKRVPDGFTELSFIRSSGAQWINTGIVPSEGVKIKIKYAIETANSAIFGAKWAENGFFLVDWQGDLLMHSGGEIATIGATNLNTVREAEISVTRAVLDGVVTNLNYNAPNVATHSIYLFMVGSLENTSFAGKIRVYECMIWNEAGLVRDYVPCKNASGQIGLYDSVSGGFFGNVGTGVFTGGDVVERTKENISANVTSMYCEVERVAARVRRGYVSIGGVARPFWGGTALVYYGAITPLSVARQKLASAAVGEYGLFACGYPYTTAVDAFSCNLTRISAAGTSAAKDGAAAATVGGHALIGGGAPFGGDAVEGYDKHLTKNLDIPEFTMNRSMHTAVANEGKAFFAGGLVGTAVDVYDDALSVETFDGLSVVRERLASAAFGEYVAFAGGESGVGSSKKPHSDMDVFDSEMTRMTMDILGGARHGIASAEVGGFAVFAGGDTGQTTGVGVGSASVCAYDGSMTGISLEDLGIARGYLVGDSIGDFAVFCGGMSRGVFYKDVDIYDKSLTRTSGNPVGTARHSLARAVVGDYLIFAGGVADGETDVAEAYLLK